MRSLAPVCEHCSSFDTLAWTIPDTPEIASATGVHMLPLIVGVPSEATVADGEIDDVELVVTEPVRPDVVADDYDAK